MRYHIGLSHGNRIQFYQALLSCYHICSDFGWQEMVQSRARDTLKLNVVSKITSLQEEPKHCTFTPSKIATITPFLQDVCVTCIHVAFLGLGQHFVMATITRTPPYIARTPP